MPNRIMIFRRVKLKKDNGALSQIVFGAITLRIYYNIPSVLIVIPVSSTPVQINTSVYVSWLSQAGRGVARDGPHIVRCPANSRVERKSRAQREANQSSFWVRDSGGSDGYAVGIPLQNND